MEKKLYLLLLVIFVISFTIGCGGEKKDTSVVSSSDSKSQTTDQKSSIDTEKLDEIMSNLDTLMKSTLGSDYSVVYDQDGVIISISKEKAEHAVSLAKSGNSEAADLWGSFIEKLQEVSTTVKDILEQNGLSGIPVTVQSFDKQDKDSALAIVVDGRVTYDASK